MDRMDISVRVGRIDPSLLLDGATKATTTEQARRRVLTARRFASARPQTSLRASLDPQARRVLEDSARRSQLSGRGVTRLLRVARTIADMAESTIIGPDHVHEAFGYRSWERA